MRMIHLVALDKTRPALILTRTEVLAYRGQVTVAPITSTIRGLSTELPVGRANGLDHDCVISLDNIVTVPTARLGRHLGYLLPADEPALCAAIMAAFDLDPPRTG